MKRGREPPFLGISRKGLLHLVHDGCEGSLVSKSDLGQGLTVQIDIRLFQLAHEHAVADAVETGSCVDTLDPQAAELAFLQLTTIIGVLKAFLYRVLGNGVHVLAATEVAFRHVEDLLPLCSAGYFILTAWHVPLGFLGVSASRSGEGFGAARPG